MKEYQAWKSNPNNIYYRRNLSNVFDLFIVYFVCAFLASVGSIIVALGFALTPFQDWFLDIGIETFALFLFPIMFLVWDVWSSKKWGGGILFSKFGKLKIVTQDDQKPTSKTFLLRAILKLLLIPATLYILPLSIWLFLYFLLVKDKQNISIIDMFTGTKAVPISDSVSD